MRDTTEDDGKKDIFLEPDDEFLGLTANGDTEGMEMLESFDDIPKPELKQLKTSVCQLIRERIYLSGFNPQTHWDDLIEEHINTEFVTGEKPNLFFYMTQNNELRMESEVPRNWTDELNYFIYTPDHKIPQITSETFDLLVQYGNVVGSGIESLLRVMSTIFAPSFFCNTTWPDSIKNDFALQLQRFMSALTDARWKMDNKTVLYMPYEKLDVAVDDAAKNKDLVNRFEMIVIHWTRQIKTVLNSQNAADELEATGPLEEIEFWRNRCEDLTGISKQLDKPMICVITEILTQAKSSYVAAFLRLADEIKFNTQQAQSNLKFLNTLKQSCLELSESPPKEIPAKLPAIINGIRMIWMNSKYYNTEEAITGMFRKISNEIVHRCCSVISLDDVFDGKVVSSSINLQHCVNCCEQYKIIYDRLQSMHTRHSGKPWDAQQRSIFAQIEAFIQRCRDLLEVMSFRYRFLTN